MAHVPPNPGLTEPINAGQLRSQKNMVVMLMIPCGWHPLMAEAMRVGKKLTKPGALCCSTFQYLINDIITAIQLPRRSPLLLSIVYLATYAATED